MDHPDRAEVVTLPPFIYLAGFAIGVTTHLAVPVGFLPPRLSAWIGAALILTASAIGLSAVRAMRRANTPFDVRQSTTTLVTAGAFGLTRNPGYLSLSLLYLGFAAIVDSIWIVFMLAPVLVLMHWGIIRPEEEYLERKFGDAYLAYKHRVRRWI